MALDYLVANGAILTCSFGSVPSALTVAAANATSDTQPVAVITDKVVGTFGTCSALGPGPCVPAIVANWSPGCTFMKLDAVACLKAGSTLECTVGGTISLTTNGQTSLRGD